MDLETMLRHAPAPPKPIDLTNIAFPPDGDLLIRARPDVHARLTSAAIHDPTVDLSGCPDDSVVLEVLAVGPGPIEDGHRLPMPFKAGDIVVGNGFFRASRTYINRVAYYLFSSKWIMSTINPDTLEVTPAPGWLITKANDERARVVLTGAPIQTVDGKEVTIHVPVNDSANNGGDGFAEDDRRDPDKMRYEEVVSIGDPPLLADGTPVEPTFRVGDLVQFSPGAVATGLTIKGRSYTQIPWRLVRLTIRDQQT